MANVEEMQLNVVTTIPKANSRLAHILCDTAGDALLYFYLALMTHLAASGPILPGPDLFAYAMAAGVGWPNHQVSTDESAGGTAVINGRTIHMDRMRELQSLMVERQQGTITDDRILRLFQLISEAPGTEVLSDPAAIFVEDGIHLDIPGPRAFLDALRRRDGGRPAPGDDILIQQLIGVFRGWSGRRVVITSPLTENAFEIRF